MGGTVSYSSYKGNNDLGGQTDDDVVNPKFLSIRIQNAFTRFNGVSVTMGEPLVKYRLPLKRLAWLTYKGPSESLSSSDAEYQALVEKGISPEFLQQGTAENIYTCFGLVWNSAGYWTYSHNGSSSSSTGSAERIETLSQVAQNQSREPDFVELLKAAVCVGSIGKGAAAAKEI